MLHLQQALPSERTRRKAQDGVIAAPLPLTDIPAETLRQMHDYWQSKCRGDRLPARADIDPLDFGWAWGVVCLLDVEPTPLRFRYRLDGSVIVDQHGRDLTGRTTDEIGPPCYADMLHAHFSEVVETAAPSAYRVTLLANGALKSYVRLALPLAGDGANVDMIMTVSRKGAEPALACNARHRGHPMR